MRILRLCPCLAVILHLAAWTSGAVAASTGGGREATALLARARAAVGGAGWDRIATLRLRYTDIREGAADESGEEVIDVPSGRYTVKVGSTPGFPTLTGWDGQLFWISQAGLSRYMPHETETSTVNHQCLSAWHVFCDASTAALSGRRVWQGKAYDVVRIAPGKGDPLEYWIDRRTARIERIAYGSGLRHLVEFADFRRIGRGLVLPFEERYTLNKGKSRVLTRINGIDFDPPLPARAFARPDNEAIGGLQGQADGVPVDFEPCDSHICVRVMLNGQGPFRFMLDTGAPDVITPQAAKRLGLTPQGRLAVQGLSDTADQGGQVIVERTALGTLSQAHQVFEVVPFTFPGIDGMLGAQWLWQCVTRIDWERHRLTFYDAAGFVYQGRAQPVTLDLQEPTPRVVAAIDGKAGWFDLDTGDWAGVTVTPSFAHATGMDTKYLNGEPSMTLGVGGVGYALRTRGERLELGGMSLARPQLLLSKQTHDFLSEGGLAGNLGHAVLRRMNIVLDYPGQRGWFEPNDATTDDGQCGEACPAP